MLTQAIQLLPLATKAAIASTPWHGVINIKCTEDQTWQRVSETAQKPMKSGTSLIAIKSTPWAWKHSTHQTTAASVLARNLQFYINTWLTELSLYIWGSAITCHNQCFKLNPYTSGRCFTALLHNTYVVFNIPCQSQLTKTALSCSVTLVSFLRPNRLPIVGTTDVYGHNVIIDICQLRPSTVVADS